MHITSWVSQGEGRDGRVEEDSEGMRLRKGWRGWEGGEVGLGH